MELKKSLPPLRDLAPMLAQAKYDTSTVSNAGWRPRSGSRPVSCGGMPELRICEDASAWDGFVSQARDASVLQASAWGSLTSRYGWRCPPDFWDVQSTPPDESARTRLRLPRWLALYLPTRNNLR